MTHVITEVKKKVLKFLVDTLNYNKIPFQVSGGLGAIAYGSTRELHDIDIEINKKNCFKARGLFKNFIVEDFRHCVDNGFELWMMRLTINDVQVDINQVEENYVFDREGNKQLLPEELIDTELKSIDDVEFPVQNRKNLIEYKKILSREVDLIDIKGILSK